jgi:hypothetical protein
VHVRFQLIDNIIHVSSDARRIVKVRFVVRALGLSLVLTTALLWGWLRLHGLSPAVPLPPPPTVAAPRGEWPSGARAFEEWAVYLGEPDTLVGCGFLLVLEDGCVVGVTTAHSLSLRNPARPLVRVRFQSSGRGEVVADFGRLFGPPGVARNGDDMTVDYVLLQPDRPVDARWVLRPDDRGTAQPGERVALISGLGNADKPRLLDGVVQSVDSNAVWIAMDGLFNPSLMSGSPFVSRHTGRVVGMLIAGALRGSRLSLAAHPIGSLMRHADSATGFAALGAVP